MIQIEQNSKWDKKFSSFLDIDHFKQNMIDQHLNHLASDVNKVVRWH